MSKPSAFRITDLISPGPHQTLRQSFPTSHSHRPQVGSPQAFSLSPSPVQSDHNNIAATSVQHSNKMIFDAQCLFSSMIMQNLSHNLFTEINPNFIANKAYERLSIKEEGQLDGHQTFQSNTQKGNLYALQQ
jgi:hypothetical protein